MTSKRLGVSSNSKALREAIFGPPPILKGESRAGYDLLLERLYADLRPTDIIEESLLHNLAHWIWELRRWRRMRVCVIEAAIPGATLWVLAAPINHRLSCIGMTHPSNVNDLNQPVTETDVKELDDFCAELGIEEHDDPHLPYNFDLVGDTIRARAFLTEPDLLARIDNAIVQAENRLNANYRAIDRRRAGAGPVWREKIRNIEEGEFEVIRPRKNVAKKAKRKTAT